MAVHKDRCRINDVLHVVNSFICSSLVKVRTCIRNNLEMTNSLDKTSTFTHMLKNLDLTSSVLHCSISSDFSTFLYFSQQYDLETIKDMYLEKYDVSLKDALRDECSGDFKRLLLAICH